MTRRLIQNMHPVTGWLAALGEPEFGHQTPDGYSLQDAAWSSSGQMSRRFEIARTIGYGSAGLFDPENGGPATVVGFPLLTTPVYYGVLEPSLSAPDPERPAARAVATGVEPVPAGFARIQLSLT